MDLQRIYIIVGIISGIVAIAGAAYKWGSSLLSWFKKKFLFSNPTLPKETIKLVLKPHGAWWHMGESKGKPAMQVVSGWFVTNITNNAILVTGAFLKKPKVHGMAMVRHPRRNIYGDYSVLSGETSDLSVDFWVQPPVNQKGEIFIGDIGILDQYGNEHLVKGVEFPYR